MGGGGRGHRLVIEKDERLFEIEKEGSGEGIIFFFFFFFVSFIPLLTFLPF